MGLLNGTISEGMKKGASQKQQRVKSPLKGMKLPKIKEDPMEDEQFSGEEGIDGVGSDNSGIALETDEVDV